MVGQLEKEYFNNYAWMDRSNVGMGYYVNLPFAFADLDDLCRDIERELDSGSLGTGFTSQGQKIDEFAEHRGYLLKYINDVLYDIADYVETPLYKGFNDAMDHMAGIDMTDGKTDNTIGLQTNVSVYGGGRGYGFENDMPYLTLEDFIGSRYQETEGSSYESTTYNQKVEGFADLFAEDYENLVKSGKINGKEVTLEKYLDSLVLKEFAYKKDSPFYLELIELLSELTVVIPIYEAAVGKTLITNDYLTDTEGAFKIVSATVNLVTLGQGALISEGGMAFAKMFASEVLAEAAAGSTAILSDKAGAPSSVTIALSLLAGAGTGMAANKALFSGYGSKAAGNVIESSGNYKTIAQDKLNNIRSQMPNNDLAKRGNMAMADVKIEGIKSEFSAHSKIDSISDKGADIANFSLKKSEAERIFKTYEPAASKIDGKPFDRFHDTEAKILEDIASQIKSPKVSGTINLYTELPACQSCTNIIFEFRRKFPNIKLNVYTK